MILYNSLKRCFRNARVAQLVERDLAKVEAAGSSPVSRFSYALDFPGLFLYAKGNYAGISFSYKKFLAMDDRHIHSQAKQGCS